MFGAELARLRSLEGVKWSIDPDDVLPAWVADMDFDPAEVVKDAVRSLVDRGDLGYNFAHRNELIPAWADWLDKYHQYRPPEDECRVFTGTLHALEVLMELETEPGDGVVVFSPIYYPFRDAILDSGRRVVDVGLAAPDWRLDPERFEAALDPTTKIVLFCQPHNPLGRIFDRDELAAFAEVAERHNLLVISDEIWGDLTHGDEHLPLYRELEGLRGRLVTLSSASKSFNIAGLRCSVSHIGDPAIRERLESFSTHFLGSTSSLGEAATVAAWTQGADWLDKVKVLLTANRDHLASRIAELDGVSINPPQATYLAWLDFAGSSIADDPSRHLYKTGRVALHAGNKFCADAMSYVRLNFATSPQILDQMIDRIELTLKESS